MNPLEEQLKEFPLSTLRKGVFIDPAPNSDGQGDGQAFAVVGALRREDGLADYFLLHVEEHNGKSVSELAYRGVQLAEDWHAEIIGVQDVTESHYCYVEVSRRLSSLQLRHIRAVKLKLPGEKKQRMVANYEPPVSTGRFYAREDIIQGKWGSQFINAAVKQQNDDLIDAASMFNGTYKVKGMGNKIVEVVALTAPPQGYRDWGYQQEDSWRNHAKYVKSQGLQAWVAY